MIIYAVVTMFLHNVNATETEKEQDSKTKETHEKESENKDLQAPMVWVTSEGGNVMLDISKDKASSNKETDNDSKQIKTKRFILNESVDAESSDEQNKKKDENKIDDKNKKISMEEVHLADGKRQGPQKGKSSSLEESINPPGWAKKEIYELIEIFDKDHKRMSSVLSHTTELKGEETIQKDKGEGEKEKDDEKSKGENKEKEDGEEEPSSSTKDDSADLCKAYKKLVNITIEKLNQLIKRISNKTNDNKSKNNDLEGKDPEDEGGNETSKENTSNQENEVYYVDKVDEVDNDTSNNNRF